MQIIRLSQIDFKQEMKSRNITDQTVDDMSTLFFICINSTGSIHSIPYFKKEHQNVINLYFDDVESSGPKEIPWINGETKTIDAVAMSEDQADELINFISKIPDSSIVYVYCAKGKSRSYAVEDFIKSVNSGDDCVSAGSNKHVYKLMRDSYAKL